MPALQPYSSEQLQQLWLLIENESLASHDITRRASSAVNGVPKFIPNGRMEKHFQEPENNFRRVKNLLRAVFNPDNSGPDRFNVSPRDVAENCSKVFCILVLIGKPGFIETFVAYDSLWDICLPFGNAPPDGFPRDPGDPQFYEKFVAEQWRFCALKLQNRNCLRINKDRILPFTESVHIGGGGTATVHRVKVHPDHDAVSPSTPSSHVYAVKTFRRINAEGNFDRELKAFRQVTDAGNRSAPGLIEFYGSFQYQGTFNIVLQYADAGTLETLFRRDQPPNTGEEIIAFWSNLFEIIRGICQIHEQHLHTDGDPNQISHGVLLQGWHQDVKPENILVLSNTGESGYPYSFKIADLGQCHFKTIMEGGPEAKDFDTFGTQTYGAPECYQMTAFSELRSNLVKRDVDIWSLGCIFSEAYVWIVKGWDGLQEFRLARKRATDDIPGWRGGNCFHNGHEMLKEVGASLERLKREFKYGDYASGRVLEILIYGTLQGEPTRRPHARVMERFAETLLTSARNELQRQSLITPPTPISVPNQSSPAQTPRSPPLGQGSPPLPSPTETPDTRFSTASASPPPFWKLGREPVIYSTPQASETENMPFINASTARMFPTNPQQTTLREIPSQPLQDQLPLRTTFPNPSYPETSLSPDGRNRALYPSPIPAISSEHIGQPSPSTARLDPALQVSPPSSSRQVNNGLRLRPSSSEVPFCSVETAQAWRSKRRDETWLAKKRKETFNSKRKEPATQVDLPHSGCLSELAGRDHVFFIDDSISMSNYWDKVSELAHLLAYMTKRMDPDGVELFFLSANERHKKYKDSTDLYDAVRKHSAVATTNLNQCFDDHLRSYAREIENTIHYNKTHHKMFGHDLPRKRSIYVLTDGVFDSGVESEGHDSIKVLVEKLTDASLPRGQIGIQFIGFGDDADGHNRLRRLDRLKKEYGLTLDVVDTEPATGNVWKMLLGAINERFDDDDDDDHENQSLSSWLSAGSSHNQ